LKSIGDDLIGESLQDQPRDLTAAEEAMLRDFCMDSFISNADANLFVDALGSFL